MTDALITQAEVFIGIERLSPPRKESYVIGWTSMNPNRREERGMGFSRWRSHRFCGTVDQTHESVSYLRC